MAKTTVFFGIALILLGGIFFLSTGHRYPTSLIPVAFGILLVVFGQMAETPILRRRMLFMHIAVTVGLLGFIATASSLFYAFQMFRGKSFLYPAAVEEKAAMAILTLIFVLLCVRSFITARRARV